MLLHFIWTHREQTLQQTALRDFVTVLVHIPHGYLSFFFKLRGKYSSDSPFKRYFGFLVFLSMANPRARKGERERGRKRENGEKDGKRWFKIVRKTELIAMVHFLFNVLEGKREEVC